MKTPEKKDYWFLTYGHNGKRFLPNGPTVVFDSKEEADRIISMTRRSNEPDTVHVVSAEWVEAEINRLKEALKKSSEEMENILAVEAPHLSSIGKEHLVWIKDKIDEVLKDE